MNCGKLTDVCVRRTFVSLRKIKKKNKRKQERGSTDELIIQKYEK